MAAVALLVPALLPAPALAQGKSAAIVLDANTGAVLHAQAADEARFPASLTKMMTLYLVFEQIEQGRLSYGTRIKMSQEAASAAPSKLDLDPGEQISLADAVKALITKSANDVAVAIGEHIAGSEPRFAELMTERARQIGLRSTTFRNASGLPHPGQTTTARDMITLGLRLHDDFPRHYAQFTTRSFTFNGDTHRNHNNLLFNYPGTEGIKTGYTRVSGFNVVVSVKREGRHVMAAVFGGSTASARDAHVRAILNRTWAKASTVRTRKAEPALVARAPQAPAPRLAARPARPVQVAQAAPKADPAPVRAAPPPPPPPQRAQPVPVAASDVAVAQVRRVMVAPRVRQTPPSETTDEARPQQVAAAAAPPPQPTRAVEVQPVVPSTPSEREAVAVTHVALMEPHADIARGDLNGATVRRRPEIAGPAPGRDTPLEATETAIAKTSTAPVRQPSTLQAQAETLAPASAQVLPRAPVVAPPPAPLPAAAAPAPAAPSSRPSIPPAPVPVRVAAPASPIAPSAQRGAAPSTLSAQAANLDRGMPPIATSPPPQQLVRVADARPAPAQAAFRLNGPDAAAAQKPAARAPAAEPGGFHIQVGAYATVAEAERQLAILRQRASPLLGAATPLTIPVQKGNRQLVRARFAGFDAPRAASACLELRRLQVDCFVMRAE